MQKAVLDFTDNSELTNFALSKAVGDDVEITFKGKFISSDGGKLSMSIDEMEFEYEDKKSEIEPSEEEPVALELFEASDQEVESSKKGAASTATSDDLMLDEEGEEDKAY